MLAEENPRYNLLENKCKLIHRYWEHSKNIDSAFKRAERINKEYERMIRHLIDQISKNKDATKNKIPEIMLRFPPMHILNAGRYIETETEDNIIVHQENKMLTNYSSP